MEKKLITIHHSPDADDAFMFYALTKEIVTSERYTYRHILCDIETLNNRALKAELECTAVSVHASALISDRYIIMPCGASMGEKDYGPRIVGRESFEFVKGKSYKIALPGKLTSTTLAAELYFRSEGIEAEFVQMPFNEVEGAVKQGSVDAGAIIHEGQVTYEREGLSLLLDLGEWWWSRHKLPLPLGVNVVRRDLGEDAIRELTRCLSDSIDYALNHREEALKHAMQYSRGISFAEADQFVGMYVNKRTVDLGDEGRESIRRFLDEGYRQHILPSPAKVEFSRP